MTKILVTGGAGFIGSHLVRGLLKDNYEVRVLDNLSTGHLENINEVINDIEFVEGDIRDERVLDKVCPGCEAVFHEAAMASVPKSILNPILFDDVNVYGTLNLLNCCRDKGVNKVIFAASSSFYGDVEVLPKIETMSEKIKSPYAATKYSGEIYLRLYHELHGLETLSLRYFNVFGPRQDPNSDYAAVLPAFIHRLLEERAPIIYGDGTQTRDFTFVENVVHANLQALKTEKLGGEVVNIGCGRRISLLELLDSLKAHLGSELVPEFKDPRPGDVMHSLADIQKAGRLIGYHPVVDLEEGVAITADWYREQFNFNKA